MGTPCLRAVRTLLEACLDEAELLGNRFNAKSWKPLVAVIKIPCVKHEARHADDGAMAYVEDLHAKVTMLIDAALPVKAGGEPSQAEKAAMAKRLAEVREKKLADMTESQREKEKKRKEKADAKRLARADANFFEKNPLAHMWHQAECAEPCCAGESVAVERDGVMA